MRTDTMFCPPVWSGPIQQFERFDVYPWAKKLHQDIYCRFFANWSSTQNLVPGHDHYLISYHAENINREWLVQQRNRLDGQMIVLFPGQVYDFVIPGVNFVSYIDWHRDLETMISWHAVQDIKPHKQHKYSAIANRITQSKIWITTKLLESARYDSLIYINNWIEAKNVHDWQLTGNATLDHLTETYRTKYINLKLSDGFDQKDNVQRLNSNPWHPIYTDSALHFTNGSFHYSFMIHEQGQYIYPGPDVDEKTLKCLLAGIPFIACGQFEIYKTLAEFGLQFDYGMDLSWDSEPGNLSRFERICNLIDDLNKIKTADIVDMTRSSTEHNRRWILSGEFSRVLEQRKTGSVGRIMSLLESC